MNISEVSTQRDVKKNSQRFLAKYGTFDVAESEEGEKEEEGKKKMKKSKKMKKKKEKEEEEEEEVYDD